MPRHTPRRCGRSAGRRGVGRWRGPPAAPAHGRWWWAGGGVPQPHRPIVAGGGQQGPVGAECHVIHRVGVAGQRGAVGLAGGGGPQPHRHTGAGGGPVAVSHSRTVRSSLVVASRAPWGLNATPRTALVWPVSGAPWGWPVAGAPSRTGTRALVVGRWRCPTAAPSDRRWWWPAGPRGG